MTRKLGVKFWDSPPTTAQVFKTIRFCMDNIKEYERELLLAHKTRHSSPDANAPYIRSCTRELNVHLEELFSANELFMEWQVALLLEL